MSVLHVKNRASSVLSAGITATDVVLTVPPGEGVRFPDNNFILTLESATNRAYYERVFCFSRSADTMQVGRGFGDTIPKSFSAGAKVELRVTAEAFDYLKNHPLTTKGDISVFGTEKSRLPVGAAGQALLVDPTAPLGVAWGTPPGAGITSGWELIRTGLFYSAINITGLRGDTDKLWMLIIKCHHLHPFAGFMTFNGDSGLNYRVTAHRYGGHLGYSLHVVFSSLDPFIVFGMGQEFFSSLLINSASGSVRQVVTRFGVSMVDSLFLFDASTSWLNNIDEITTINILVGSHPGAPIPSINFGEYWLFRTSVGHELIIPPLSPSGLIATAVSSSQINLGWIDNSDNEAGFRIERSTGIGGIFTEIATVGFNVTSFHDTGLTPNTTYFYRVRAFNVVGNSDFSNEASATTTFAPLPPPPPLSTIFERRVIASSDDCSVHFDGNGWHFSLVDHNVSVGHISATRRMMGSGMRFVSIHVPQGATIVSAFLILHASQTMDTPGVHSILQGEYTGYAAPFSSYTDFTMRERTISSIPWSSTHLLHWSVDVPVISPDISSIIQEIVNRPDWITGSNMVIFWDDISGFSLSGSWRHAYSFEGRVDFAPLLRIEYI